MGTKALQKVINAALAHNKTVTATPPPKPDTAPFKMVLTSFYMHVQTSNVDARRFYERNGFVEIGRVDGYYKKLEPHDAWILEKQLTATDADDEKK